jgi:glutaredoxin
MSSMKSKWGLGLLLCSVVLLLTACGGPGKYDEFASCLSEKGATMYGTDWCPHCKAQKELFGKSFKNIIYTNCDKAKNLCDEAGVEGFPTWVFGEERASGTQSFAKLAEMSGCELPSEK